MHVFHSLLKWFLDERRVTKRPKCKLLLESLEDRTVPSTVTIGVYQNGSESGTDGVFRISRDDTIGDLTVSYSVEAANSSATNGQDFSSLSGSATIPDGSSYVDVHVVPLGDSHIEGSETLQVDLQTASCCSGGTYALGSPSGATLLLGDDDFNAPEDDNEVITNLNDFSEQIETLLSELGTADGQGVENNLFSQINPILDELEGYLAAMELVIEASGNAEDFDSALADYDEIKDNLVTPILNILAKADQIIQTAEDAANAAQGDYFRLMGIGSDMLEMNRRLGTLSTTLDDHMVRINDIAIELVFIEEDTPARMGTLSSISTFLNGRILALGAKGPTAANICWNHIANDTPANAFISGLNAIYYDLDVLRVDSQMATIVMYNWSNGMDEVLFWMDAALQPGPGQSQDDFNAYFDGTFEGAGLDDGYAVQRMNLSSVLAGLRTDAEQTLEKLGDAEDYIAEGGFEVEDEFRMKGIAQFAAEMVALLEAAQEEVTFHLQALQDIRTQLVGLDWTAEITKVDAESDSLTLDWIELNELINS